MKSMGSLISIIIAVFSCIAGSGASIFGFLFVLGSGGKSGGGGGDVVTGVILLVVGIIFLIVAVSIAFYAYRRSKKAAAGSENITYKVDLPANVKLDQMKCKSCGGAITMENIQMVAGAPVVNCPYCHSTYQLTEEPKW